MTEILPYALGVLTVILLITLKWLHSVQAEVEALWDRVDECEANAQTGRTDVSEPTPVPRSMWGPIK